MTVWRCSASCRKAARGKLKETKNLCRVNVIVRQPNVNDFHRLKHGVNLRYQSF